MTEPRIERIGDAILYEGDCYTILPTLPPVDAVVTDPPYGIQRFTKGFGTTRFKGHGAEKDGFAWDKKPTAEFFASLLKSCTESIIWGANNFELPASEYFFVWDKMQTVDNFASAELAYTNIKMPAKVFRYSIHQHNQTFRDHPTTKPVPLMEWCITFTSGAVVLDPFMGSGTTGVACANLGRKFIGIERDPKYFDIACERITAAYSQGRLFA
jgi:site-specific DNA-methyltransferase (adenine-specific)